MQLNSIIIDADEYQAMKQEILELKATVKAQKTENANLHSYIDDLRHNIKYTKKQISQLTTPIYGDDDEIIDCPVVRSAIGR